MSAALKSPDLSLDAAFVLACLRRYREHQAAPQRVADAGAVDTVLIGDLMDGSDRVAFLTRDPIRTALRATVRDVAWRVHSVGGAAALAGLFRDVTQAAGVDREWAERTLGNWLRGVGERP